jgi:hypothetical protein
MPTHAEMQRILKIREMALRDPNVIEELKIAYRKEKLSLDLIDDIELMYRDMGTETDAFLREVKWPMTASDFEVNQANLQALKMLGANGTSQGDTQKGVTNLARARAYVTGPYARARAYARAHDYWGLFNETRAKNKYPTYYALYHRMMFWREFVNYTPERKVEFHSKFEAAKFKYPAIFLYYVYDMKNLFWLTFLEWDTQHQTEFAEADARAREKYPWLVARYASLGKKEQWTKFVNMTPEAQTKIAHDTEEMMANEKRKEESDYFFDHGTYGGGDGHGISQSIWYNKDGTVQTIDGRPPGD